MTHESIPLALGLTAIYITHDQLDERDDYDEEEVW